MKIILAIYIHTWCKQKHTRKPSVSLSYYLLTMNYEALFDSELWSIIDSKFIDYNLLISEFINYEENNWKLLKYMRY